LLKYSGETQAQSGKVALFYFQGVVVKSFLGIALLSANLWMCQ
jgi:hypothetical protein